MKKVFAFTLAEVLITLGVIGVVAAITIPSITQKYKEKETVIKLKRVYSILQAAHRRAQDDYGFEYKNDVDWSTIETQQRGYLEKIMPYLKIANECKDNKKACYTERIKNQGNVGQYYTHLQGEEGTSYLQATNSSVLLQDGTLIAIMATGNRNTHNTRILVDINGPKKPNRYGHDTFFFQLNDGTNEVLEPDDAWKYSFSRNSCKLVNGAQAQGCAAWVLKYENTKFQRCDDPTTPTCK